MVPCPVSSVWYGRRFGQLASALAGGAFHNVASCTTAFNVAVVNRYLCITEASYEASKIFEILCAVNALV